MFKMILALILAMVTPAAALAQQPAPLASPQPRHLIVLNKPGPNFARGANHREEMLKHRQIYLDLTAEGKIIASGTVDFEPRVGFILFRQDIDEVAIRSRLENDFAVREGILELEYHYWSIQMGGFGSVGEAGLEVRK
ncbi:MAG: hypothetical protein H2054_00230 [Sphingomonas sp.]|uniref:hypothetical protein n=1 Tax=Sphingomonas sp. TaxID=28214 RepID=UPI000DB0D289|nr:hypothetical protein [Zymomonas sp.]MBA4041230.1 hypothetical protein [Sphingobium sp.]MBA4771515.1 hypothetical protein [Sphingomonas sp.]PZP18865.1 MAG: hypothetical protein DI607_04015 [Sphingomonas hengshuiensis]